MYKNKRVAGLILVAGNSTRFAKDRNKNFELLNGTPIINYSLLKFINNKYIDEIIIVGKKEEQEIIKKIISPLNSTKKIKLVIGGNTRQESVYNGLNNISCDIVIIQDGARPGIKDAYLNNCLAQMDNYVGVSIGVRTKDTVKIVDKNGLVLQTTDRDYTWLMQTPQCFDYKILKELHNKYRNNLVTDDCMLLEKAGYPVKIIEGDDTNLKVTTCADLKIMNVLLK